MVIACKFGGTSLATAGQLRKVNSIIRENPERRYVVVSAPGKRDPKDVKVTDLLYHCYEMARDGLDFSDTLERIKRRYDEIIGGLSVDYDMAPLFKELEGQIKDGVTREFIVSRGEYLMGRLVAVYLGGEFVDAAEGIFLTGEGRLREESYSQLSELLRGDGIFVVPGFYGRGPGGKIKTFSRGGSDITGAIVARAVGAELYENWTDVDGFYMADPTIVPDANMMKEVTYQELRELSYMGAGVLHDEAIFPVKERDIPIQIRNTNNPESPGTRILRERDYRDTPIVGVAGRKNFSMIYVEKALMNKMKGFGRRLLGIVENHDISFEHIPTSIDSICVIIKDEQLGDKGEDLIDDIRRSLQPDRVELVGDLAMVTTVGEGMAYRVGTAARLFKAVAEAGVNVRIIDQGASEINIMIGVENSQFDRAIKAIYHEFIPQ